MKNIIFGLGAGFVILFGLAFAIGLGMWPGFHTPKYYLDHPDQSSERIELIKELKSELKEWGKWEWDEYSGYDADRHWPIDRLTIVIAIQEYYLKNNRLAADKQQLIDSEILDIENVKVVKDFQLKLSDKNWELSSRAGFVFAKGN